MPAIATRLAAPSSSLQTSALGRSNLGQSTGPGLSLGGNSRLVSLLPMGDMPDSFAQAAVPRSAVWRPVFPDNQNATPPAGQAGFTKVTTVIDKSGVAVPSSSGSFVPPVSSKTFLNWRGNWATETGTKAAADYILQSMGSEGNASNGANITLHQTFPSNNTAGGTILVVVWVQNQDVSSGITVSDTKGNTYTQLRFLYAPTANAQAIAIFVATNIAAGSNQVTTVIHPGSGSQGEQIAYVLELKAGIIVVDTANAALNGSNGNPPINLTATGAQDLAILVGSTRVNSTFTPTAGFSALSITQLGGGGSDPSPASAVAVNANFAQGAANAGFTVSPSNPDAYGLAGIALQRPATGSYQPYDVVEFQGEPWVALVATTLSPVQSPASWALLSQVVQLKTNFAQNGSQGLLNLVAGSGMTITDDGSGDITLAVAPGSPSDLYFIPNIRNRTLVQANGSSTTLGAIGDSPTFQSASPAAFAVSAKANGIVQIGAGVNVSYGVFGLLNYRGDHNFAALLIIGPGVSVANVRIWVGLTDQSCVTMTASANPVGNYAAFRFDTGAGDANWKCITKDGTTQNIIASTGAAPVLSTAQRFGIIYDNVNSKVTFWIDGVLVGTSFANLPTKTTALRFVTGGQSSSGSNALNFEYVAIEQDF